MRGAMTAAAATTTNGETSSTKQTDVASIKKNNTVLDPPTSKNPSLSNGTGPAPVADNIAESGVDASDTFSSPFCSSQNTSSSLGPVSSPPSFEFSSPPMSSPAVNSMPMSPVPSEDEADLLSEEPLGEAALSTRSSSGGDLSLRLTDDEEEKDGGSNANADKHGSGRKVAAKADEKEQSDDSGCSPEDGLQNSSKPLKVDVDLKSVLVTGKTCVKDALNVGGLSASGDQMCVEATKDSLVGESDPNSKVDIVVAETDSRKVVSPLVNNDIIPENIDGVGAKPGAAIDNVLSASSNDSVRKIYASVSASEGPLLELATQNDGSTKDVESNIKPAQIDSDTDIHNDFAKDEDDLLIAPESSDKGETGVLGYAGGKEESPDRDGLQGPEESSSGAVSVSGANVEEVTSMDVKTVHQAASIIKVEVENVELAGQCGKKHDAFLKADLEIASVDKGSGNLKDGENAKVTSGSIDCATLPELPHIKEEPDNSENLKVSVYDVAHPEVKQENISDISGVESLEMCIKNSKESVGNGNVMKQDNLDLLGTELMETDEPEEEAHINDNSNNVDVSGINQNECQEPKIECDDLSAPKLTADYTINEGKGSLKANLANADGDEKKSDDHNELDKFELPEEGSEPSKFNNSERTSASFKELLSASSDKSNSSEDNCMEECGPKPDYTGVHGADVIASDSSEATENDTSLKRPTDGDEPASKRARRSTDDDDLLLHVSGDKENNKHSPTKRLADHPLARNDVKRERTDSDAAVAKSNGTNARLNGKPSAQKPMSNLDKAIARVATGGLNKRERETVELLKLLDHKKVEHITAPQLDDLVKLKICEVVTKESETGKMHDKVATFEATIEKWRELARCLAKQVRDLELVFKKMTADGKQENQTVLPIKITRSVGLQVGTGSLTAAQQQQIQQQQLQRKVAQQQQQQKKTTGIITNRPTMGQQQLGRPPIARQVPTPGGVRMPVQPQAAQPPPAVGKTMMAASGRVVQASAAPGKSPSASPNKSILNPTVTGLSSTYPGPTRMAPAPTARVTPNVTRVAVNGARPAAQARPVPSSKPPAGCIDLTDEDDKVTVGNPVTIRSVSIVSSPTQGQQVVPSGIRIVPQNQLTGSPSAQLPGNRNMITVTRPRMALPQNVILGSASVLTPNVRPNAANSMRRIVANVQSNIRTNRVQPVHRHPAPLPPSEYALSNSMWKLPPPQPELKISKCDSRQRGIILSWKMESFCDSNEVISTYQLYAYQEPANASPQTSMWKKVGDVKSMPLPMACTLTQFSEGNKYHFAVRAVDVRNRTGPFSVPGSIILPRTE